MPLLAPVISKTGFLDAETGFPCGAGRFLTDLDVPTAPACDNS
jgi:hypothetical protein